MDIKNDLWLRVPGNLVAQAVSKSGKSHVWMYYTGLRKENGNRAHHGNEFAMVFGREDSELVTAETARKVRQTWLEFVRKGAPQGAACLSGRSMTPGTRKQWWSVKIPMW